MRVEIGDYTYFVLFRVTEYDPPLNILAKYARSHGKSKGKDKYLQISHVTRCAIKRALTASKPDSLSADYIVYNVESHCSRWDYFDLHKGRRNALKKALDVLYGLTELDSKPFWDAFVKTLPKPTPTVKQLKQELFKLKTRVNEINNMASLTNLVK